ncbi:MAG: NUDIX hydrolase [Chloroflexota bacterium]
MAGVVIKGGKVLLVLRASSRKYYPGVWDLCGGHVREAEALEVALRREVYEELGINVKAHRLIGVVHEPVEPADIHLFAISDWDGEPMNIATEEHTEISWFSESALPESNALDAYRAEVVKALRAAD